MGSSSVPVESSSSSSSPNFDYNYHVFFSFRGEDTRYNFTSHLHMALRLKGFNVFIDNRLERGEQISKSLLKSIEVSRISIVIFSKNYAYSSWCLDELVKIIDCKKSKGQLVLPVFYKVDPYQIRKQTGGFGKALAKHEANKLLNNRIQLWKEALSIAANLSGWHLEPRQDEAELIQAIVRRVVYEINRTQLRLKVAEHPVGVNYRLRKIEELVSRVGSKGVNMVGMYGIGGIGKTTLAKALYNKIAPDFEAYCFIQDVRQKLASKYDIAQLQEILLNTILKDFDPIKVVNRDEGVNIIKSRFNSKKVLIVLDDVNHRGQLEALVGGRDWFGQGSKIIVTTRDKHLLTSHGFDEKQKIRELNHDHSLELFSLHAFNDSRPPNNYLDLSKNATSYCKGLSLALVVLASLIRNTNPAEWSSILNGFKMSLSKEVKDVLQLSFDRLEQNAKEVFLDISCFFVGEEVNYVKKMLNACDLDPNCEIIHLMDLSLITIENDNMQMHELTRRMGHEIVKGESVELGKRSRLWLVDEVSRVLSDNSGTNAIQAIKLDCGRDLTKLDVNPGAFRNMQNLRLLMVRNAIFSTKLKYMPDNLRWIEWHGFAHGSLPSCFITKHLVGLDLQQSLIRKLGKRFKNGERLKLLDLSHSALLEKIAEFPAASNLEEVYLKNCTSLRSIPDLSKVVILDLDHCSNLKKIPSYPIWNSLTILTLNHCKRLEKLSDFSGASNLKELYLEGCINLRVVHESFGSLNNLVTLDVSQCTKLVKLPSKLKLKSLVSLKLSGCRKLKMFPNIDENMKSLVHLDLDFTAIRELPSSIGNLTKLFKLNLKGCTNLISLPNTIYLLKDLFLLQLNGCCRFEMFPYKLETTIHAVGSCSKIVETSEFVHLRVPEERLCLRLHSLDLEGCNISNVDFLQVLSNVAPYLDSILLSGNKFSSLPSCLHKFKSLRILQLRNCKFLQQIPNLPHLIQKVDATGCISLRTSPYNMVDVISIDQDPFHTLQTPKEFVLMNTGVPEWLSYRTIRNSIRVSTFQDNGNYTEIKSLTASVTFRVVQKMASVSCNIFIGNKLEKCFMRNFPSSTSEYTWLVTTPTNTTRDHRSFKMNDRNNVTLWFEVVKSPEVVTITSCGVHLTRRVYQIIQNNHVEGPRLIYTDFDQPDELPSSP